MNKATQNSILSFKDELHARPYIKLGNNLRTFHFAYLIKENDEKKTLLSAGRAILITGSTIIMGFLVFLFSNFNPTILFGVFSGIAIFFAMFLSIYLLPRILDLQSK